MKAWREKKWVEIIAPPYFGSQKIGETFASDEKSVVGRVLEVSLADLTQDFSRAYILLKFKITEVADGKAKTMFFGHEAMYEYFRSFIRRRLSKVQSIVTVRTKDGYVLRITAVILTQHKAKTSQEKAMRKEMVDLLTKRAAERNFDQLVQEMVLSKLAMDIHKVTKKYCPIRRVEIQKSKVLEVPH